MRYLINLNIKCPFGTFKENANNQLHFVIIATRKNNPEDYYSGIFTSTQIFERPNS